MAHAHHDRLDLKLLVTQYTEAQCGSLNLLTGRAEYCDFGCETLKARMTSGEDAGAPLNRWPPTDVVLP